MENTMKESRPGLIESSFKIINKLTDAENLVLFSLILLAYLTPDARPEVITGILGFWARGAIMD